MHALSPAYLADELQLASNHYEVRRRLRLAISSLLTLSCTCLAIVGDRAFPVAAVRTACHLSILTISLEFAPCVGPMYPFLPFSSLVHSLPHLLLFYYFPLPVLIHLTYFLLLSIPPFLPESSHSVSRPEVVGGDRTWVLFVPSILYFLLSVLVRFKFLFVYLFRFCRLCFFMLA